MYHRGERGRQQHHHDSFIFPSAGLSSSQPPGPSRISPHFVSSNGHHQHHNNIYVHSHPNTRAHHNHHQTVAAAPSSRGPPSLSSSSCSSIEDNNHNGMLHNTSSRHSSPFAHPAGATTGASSINRHHPGSLDLFNARQKLQEFQVMRQQLTAKAAVVA